MGFLVSQHGELGAIPPPPFLRVSPLKSMRIGCAIPPPPHKKGYLGDTCATPHENKANGCDTPLCDTISKRYCAIWGVSRTGPLRATRTPEMKDKSVLPSFRVPSVLPGLLMMNSVPFHERVRGHMPDDTRGKLSAVFFQCHAEGGVTKGGVSKRRQTLTNASKRRGENASKREQTRAKVDKRKQTLTPPFIAVFFYTPLCNPLILGKIRAR